MKFKRITKREAKKLFSEGKVIIFCPCKMYPGGPWRVESYIHSVDWLNRHESLAYAWEIAYNNWSFYNTSYETGYYAHYYVEV